MNADLAMVMPMAGRGSRFSRVGIDLPKPLIPLHGRPFFWWATESLRRQVPLRELIYVVLREHCETFQIDDEIRRLYPAARVVTIPEVTAGAAETAMVGLRALGSDGPVAINDCDHAFDCPGIGALLPRLGADLGGALMTFRSRSSSYSYAAVDPSGGRVTHTVEKQAISDDAIAGCYFIGKPAGFTTLYEDYARDCPYDELFMSGVFNLMIRRQHGVGLIRSSIHRSFGTPDELSQMTLDCFEPLLGWT